MKHCVLVLSVLIGQSVALLAATGVVCAAQVEYTGYTYRDPFDPQIPKEPKETQTTGPKAVEAPVNVDFLSLSGVVWDSAKPQAIINGHVVQVGGKVDGAEIVSIERARVGVRYKGSDFTLTTGAKKGGQP